MSVTLELRGFDEALEALNLDVEGQLGATIDHFLRVGTEVAQMRTPVATGAMRGAWHWARSGLEGRMGINPSATNPRSGAPVTSYAPLVDDRLGIVDAAYQRVVTMPIEEVGWNGH